MAIINAPTPDLRRSPAAAAVAALAEASEIDLAHFEHRHHLPSPEHWQRLDRADLCHDPGAAGWTAGVIREQKYSHFRLDSPHGSFNPGHRGKWTTHELCHQLTGFGWRPGADHLFHALAARLSEVLPVALYYFFDEVGLRRCPDHQGGGPLFNDFCPACEAATAQGPVVDPEADRWIEAGRAFVARELDAVARSRRAGRPLPHRYATLDLASDGVAYAAAHFGRLSSPEWADFMDRFYGPSQGWFDDLDALATRVEAVMAAITEGAPLEPLSGGRWHRAAQDLAWRIYQIKAETRGPLLADLDGLLDELAGDRTLAGLAKIRGRYDALAEEWYLPPTEEIFSVGYPVPDADGRLTDGRSLAGISAGVASICPGALEALGDEAEAALADFTAADEAIRAPLGLRFARFLQGSRPGAAADLALFEATVAHPPSFNLAELILPAAEADGGLWRRAPRAAILLTGVDVVAFAEDPSADPLPSPDAVVVGRRVDGELDILQIPRAWAEVVDGLGDAPVALSDLPLDEEAIATLIELAVLQPTQWRLATVDATSHVD